MNSKEALFQDYLQQLIYKYAGNSCTREEMEELLTIVNQEDNQEIIVKAFRAHWEGINQFDNSTIGQYANGDWDRKFYQMMGEVREFDNSTMSQFDNEGLSTRGLGISNKEQGISNDEVDGVLSTRGIDKPENEKVEVKVEVERRTRVIRIWRKVVAAAIIIGLIVTSYVLFVQDNTKQPSFAEASAGKDVKAPEVSRAMITLGDGRVVYLDSAGNGALANVEGVEVMKMADGKIVYREASIVNREGVNRDALTGLSMTFNTLTNPRGSKVIDITLSDGSRVWLNAGSSLRYPVVFGGDKREVELEGEGYFEVAKVKSTPIRREADTPAGGGQALRRKVPFLVRSGEVVTEVLGTHFNVNAYGDEGSVDVTLLEGSVNVKRESSIVKLVPRQSAFAPAFDKSTAGKKASAGEAIQVQSNVDIEEVMAWKNGRFMFGDKADLKSIMRELSRWYDVDVEYRGNVNVHFGGSISRTASLSDVLKALEATGNVQFKIDGKKVVVSP